VSGSSSALAGHHLGDQVRAAADNASNEQQSFDLIRAADILIRLRTTHQNKVSGFAVGQADHRSAAGGIIWFGGGRLTDDLTLPKSASDGSRIPKPRTRFTETTPHQPPLTDHIR
jgi:hypothetical protein